MSVVVKNFIPAKHAQAAINTEFVVPGVTKFIIDKFTATNTDSVARTITVYLVPSGGTAGLSNIITSVLSIAANTSINLPEMQNQVLEAGDFVAVEASIASKVVIRASGREVT